MVYRQAHGVRGNLTWDPVKQGIDTLYEALYLSLDRVQLTGQRHLVALDVSGAMTDPLQETDQAGLRHAMPVTPCDAAAALAVTISKTESNDNIIGSDEAIYPQVAITTTPRRSRGPGGASSLLARRPTITAS